MAIEKKLSRRREVDADKVLDELQSEAVTVSGVHKSYGDHEVLKGIDFTVHRGEIFGLLGRNGVGKSTTIDCIIGAKEFDDGEIKIYGLDIEEYPIEAKSLYGYVPSEPLLYDQMTGYEYLQFIASAYGVGEESFQKNVDFLDSRFELGQDALRRPIGGYSHGMKQKCGLMASLLHNPRLWILDEPTVGLDVMAYETLLQMMKQYAARGNTIVVTSHNIDLIADVCSRVAIINDGKVATLIDFVREPYKKKDLKTIFFKVYRSEKA